MVPHFLSDGGEQNVETVLDELRPFLMADGGNVEVVEIDGPIVKVRLQGACGSCPSSTMTLKMGIERKLKEIKLKALKKLKKLKLEKLVLLALEKKLVSF